MKPLFETDSIEKDLQTIRDNVSDIKCELYQITNIDEQYIESLEFATSVKDEECRKRISKVARDLKCASIRQNEAYKKLDVICKQLIVVIDKINKG